VARLALGCGGGVCYDLVPPFAWVLRQLGATARLCAAWVATADGGYLPLSTHVIAVVDFADGSQYIADPAFGDPPRTAVSLEGDSADALASYRVISDEEGMPEGCTMVLQCERGSASLCRHIDDLDNSAKDGAMAAWAPLYAFRSEDDLAPDSEILGRGLQEILAPEKTFFAQKRLVCLGLPKGHVVLSERRLRRVEGGAVAEEVAVESEEDWQRHAASILGRPLLAPPPKEAERRMNSWAPPAAQVRPFDANKAQYVGSAQMGKAYASQEMAASKSKNLGLLNGASLAVGGAGQGGGLGLNAPGFGPRVRHFSGGGANGGSAGGAKSIQVSADAISAWSQVLDDKDPTSYVYCEYAADGKTLELAGKGAGGLEEFKATLGDSIAWGGFRCYAVDKRGSVECKRAKFVFVQHKPEGASAMKKAKQGSHRGDVKEAFTGTHMDLMVESLEDLREETIIAKLQAAAGAHKPNGYEFGEGVFLEADFYGLGIGRDCKGETSKNNN